MLRSNLCFVDGFVDLLHDPHKLPTVDALHKGIAHVPCRLSIERGHDRLPPSQSGLSAERLLQVFSWHFEEVCCHLSGLAVLNV